MPPHPIYGYSMLYNILFEKQNHLQEWLLKTLSLQDANKICCNQLFP